jgi:hypothetical protein
MLDVVGCQAIRRVNPLYVMGIKFDLGANCEAGVSSLHVQFC